jgi:hypothetical protein
MNKLAGRLAVHGLMAAAALAAVVPLAAQSPVGDWALLSQTIDAARTRATADEKRECERRDAALRSWVRIQQDRASKPDAAGKASAAHQEAATTCAAARERRAQADALWERLNSVVGQRCEAGAPAACPQAVLAAELFGASAAPPPAGLQPRTAKPTVPAAPLPPTITFVPSPAPESARAAADAASAASDSAAVAASAAASAVSSAASAADSAASAAAAAKPPVCSFKPGQPFLSSADAAKDQPDPDKFKELMAKAAAAQAKVKKLKQETGDAFGIGDGAAKVGLDAAAAVELRLEGNRASRQHALNLTEQAAVAFAAAHESRSATSQAQIASNTLVRCTLQLAMCRLDGRCQMTQKEAYDEAVAAEVRLAKALETGTKQAESAKKESRKQDLAGLSQEQAERKNRYLDMLDRNPDAQALVGDDAALIRAGKEGTEGVIRLSLARLGFDNARRLTLQLSAPLNDGEATVAERRADRLSARPKVTLAWNGVTLLDKPNALISYGLTATIGRESQPYIDPTKPEQLKLSTKPRGLGLTATLIRDERGLHTLGVERQRTWEPGKTGVVCPLPATGATSVRCLSGSLGVPTQLEATVSTYSYRRKTTFLGDALGLGIEATYNDKSREFDLSIPIYFIQSSDSTKSELNAGIRIGLVNKRDPANGRDTSLGLFVSSPFKIGGN